MGGTWLRCRVQVKPAARILLLVAALLAVAALCGMHGLMLEAGVAMALAMGRKMRSSNGRARSISASPT